MRLINLLFLLFISFFMMSFNLFKRDYCEMAKEIRSKVGKNLAKRHNMDCIGIGGGMMDSIYMIELSFQIHHPMDREEARWRIVDCAEELLKAINENIEIRPFLEYYPFTTKNIKVAIFITHPNGKEVLHPNLCGVSLFESDYITYYTTEENCPIYKTKEKESYQEALDWINERKTSSTIPKQCDYSKK